MKGIGRQTDYAARIVLHLASLPPGSQLTAGEISAARILPAPFVRRIVGRLAAAGILRTSRGARGGVSLARPAEEISLLDILRAMEGGVVLNACVDDAAACPLTPSCPVQKQWVRATRAVENLLAEITFDAVDRGLDSGPAAEAMGFAPGSGFVPVPPPAGREREK